MQATVQIDHPNQIEGRDQIEGSNASPNTIPEGFPQASTKSKAETKSHALHKDFLPKDTIPEGFRIALHADFPAASTPPDHFNYRQTAEQTLASDLAYITLRLTLYNKRVKKLSYADRQRHNLPERLILTHAESATIQHTGTIKAPPRDPWISNNNKVLRSIAKANGVPARERWRRFPPQDLEDRQNMAKETSRAPLVATPQGATLDPKLKAFTAYLRRKAQDHAKSTGGIAASYLSDTAWKASQKLAYDKMMAIDLDIEI